MKYIFITSHLSTFNVALNYFIKDIEIGSLNEIYLHAVKRNALFEHFKSFRSIGNLYADQIDSNFEIKDFNSLRKLNGKNVEDVKIITTRYDHDLTINTTKQLQSFGYRLKAIIELGESYGIKPRPYSLRVRFKRFLIKLSFKLFSKIKLVVKYCLSENSFDKIAIQNTQEKLNSYFDSKLSKDLIKDSLINIDKKNNIDIQNEFNNDTLNLILLFPFLKVKTKNKVKLLKSTEIGNKFTVAENSIDNINTSCLLISNYINNQDLNSKINLIIKLHPKNTNLDINFLKFIKEKIRKNSNKDINIFKLNTSIIVEQFLHNFNINNNINLIYGFGTNIVSSKIVLIKDKKIDYSLVNSSKYLSNSIKSNLINYLRGRGEFLRFKHVSKLLKVIERNEL